MPMQEREARDVAATALVYGGLAAYAGAVYLVLVIGGGRIVGAGDEPHLGLSLLATALLAVSFTWVRRRLRALTMRLLHGVQATPYETLSRFADRVAQTYSTADVLPRIASAVAAGTGARVVEVWLASGSTMRKVASYPEEHLAHDPAPYGEPGHFDGTDYVVPIKHGSELLGLLQLKQLSDRSVQHQEDKLLRDLAAQAGIVLSNVRLNADLEARLTETSQRAADIRASRARIVALQDAERRRLERDIHDGAQQHLVALAVQLRLAKVLLARTPEKAHTLLTDLRGATDGALATLQALSEGIYPPDLADRGIATALRRQERASTVRLQVDDAGIGRYAEDIEAAVYFSCLEAIQNAAKHAASSEVVVRLEDDAAELRFTVRDDGRGFDVATATPGVGLSSIEDRLAGVGGVAIVASAPGLGTTVSGTVPLLPASVRA